MVDRRRIDYIESLLGRPAPPKTSRAQILFWAFFGYALADQPLPADRQQAVLDELLRIVAR